MDEAVETTDVQAPLGFRRFPGSEGNAFLALCGGVWGRLQDGRATLGFRVQPMHCNRAGQCHGGMLLTFADSILPLLARFQERREDGLTPTVSMSADFLSPACLGEWVEGEGRLLRRTGNLLFIEGLITAADRPVLRVSSIFRRGRSGENATRLAEMLDALGGDRSDSQ